MNRVEIEQLRGKIREMTPQTALYKMLKEELSMLGYWRNRQRGNPRAGYQAMVEKINNQTKDSD